MMIARVLTVTLLSVLSVSPWFVSLATGAENDVFDLRVTRIRMLRNQAGVLHVDREGITFRSSDGKTTVEIPMKELREADVANPRALHFETYDVRKWQPM